MVLLSTSLSSGKKFYSFRFNSHDEKNDQLAFLKFLQLRDFSALLYDNSIDINNIPPSHYIVKNLDHYVDIIIPFEN